MADKNIKLVIEAILKDKGFQKGVKGMGTQMKKTSAIAGGFSKVLGALGLAGGIYALVGVIKKAIKVQMEFEQSIANVASVSGDSKKQLKAIALENAKLGFTATEASNAMYYLASSGMKAQEMAKVLAPTLTLAAAAQMGIAEATDIVVNNLKVFATEGIKAQKIVDIMAQTVRSSNTNMAQMAEAAKYAGSEMSLANVKFADMAATIGAMANMGYKGSEAGAKLRMVYARLGGNIPPVTKALKKYNITQDQITKLLPTPIKLFELLRKANISNADATQIFGVRNKAVFKLIRDGLPDLKKLQLLMKDTGGVAKKMAEVQLDTLQGAIKQLNVEWHKFAISLETGEASKGIVRMGAAIGTFATKSVAYINMAFGVWRDIFKRIGSYSKMIWAKISSHVRESGAKAGKYTLLAYYKIRGIINKQYKLMAKSVEKEIKNLGVKEYLIRARAQSKWNEIKRNLWLKNEYYIMKLSKQLGEKVNEEEYKRLLTQMVSRGLITKQMYEEEMGIFKKNNEKKENEEKKHAEKSIIIQKGKIEKQKSMWSEMTEDEKVGAEMLLKSIKKLGDAVGGEMGGAINAVTDFTESIMKNSEKMGIYAAIVIAAITFIVNEFQKAQAHMEKMQALTVQNMEQVDLERENQQIAKLERDKERMLERFNRQKELLDKQYSLETENFAYMNDVTREYYNFLKATEAERYAQMSEKEKREYDLRKKYEEQKRADEKKLEEEKKAEIAKADAIIRAAKMKRFSLEKDIEIQKTKIDWGKAQAEVWKNLPMFWDDWKRNRQLNIINSMFENMIGLIKSRQPAFAEGTERVKETGLATVHAGERIIPANMNIPNINNAELITAAAAGMPIMQTSGIHNTTNNDNANNSRSLTIQNVTLPNVTNAKELLLEMQGIADEMGTSLLNV